MALNMMWILIIGVVGWLVFSNKNGGLNIANIFKQYWGLGVAVGVVSVAVSKWIYPWISKFFGGSIATIKLANPLDIDVASKLQTGLDTTIGEKFFGFFNGLLPIQGSTWLWAIITGILVIVGGRIAYTYLYKGTQKTKLPLIMLYGTLLFGVVFKLTTPSLSIEFFSLILTLGIYYLILSLLLTMAYRWLDFPMPN